MRRPQWILPNDQEEGKEYKETWSGSNVHMKFVATSLDEPYHSITCMLVHLVPAIRGYYCGVLLLVS